MNIERTVRASESSRLMLAAAERYTAALRSTLGQNLVSVVLFGSVARGEARPNSDIDLLIVAEELPRGRFARLLTIEAADRAFEEELDRLRALGLEPRVTTILKARHEARDTVPLYLDMVEDARLLHDREGFFAGVLDRLRASLARLGAQRRQLGTVRYWVLKPGLKLGEVIEL